MIPAIAALVSAVCFYFGLGLYDAWPLAWIAPLPILWLAYGEARGWKVALAALAAYALGQAFLIQAYGGPMLPMILVVVAGQAVAFSGIVLLSRWIARRLPAGVAWLGFPALWTAFEFAASFMANGTYGSWAYSQVGQPLLIQSASVFGLWSISFLIAAVASLFALASRRRSLALAAGAAILLGANIAFGAARLSAPLAPAVEVAVAARDDDGYSDRGQDHIEIAQATVKAEAAEARVLAAKGARYIVFPEKAAMVRPAWRDRLYAPLALAADETGSVIITGFDQNGPDRRNLAVVFAPHQPAFSYAKRHMVPGFEAMFRPGPGPGLFAKRRAVVVCKDMDFQSTLRGDARAGAGTGGIGLMFAPAWDFGADAWAHARMGILRGVEGGYGVVRSAKQGLVTISDAQGRILARATSGKRDYVSVIASVPEGAGGTPYLRIGDLFAWACAGLAGFLVLAATVRRRSPG